MFGPCIFVSAVFVLICLYGTSSFRLCDGFKPCDKDYFCDMYVSFCSPCEDLCIPRFRHHCLRYCAESKYVNNVMRRPISGFTTQKPLLEHEYTNNVRRRIPSSTTQKSLFEHAYTFLVVSIVTYVVLLAIAVGVVYCICKKKIRRRSEPKNRCMDNNSQPLLVINSTNAFCTAPIMPNVPNSCTPPITQNVPNSCHPPITPNDPNWQTNCQTNWRSNYLNTSHSQCSLEADDNV